MEEQVNMLLISQADLEKEKILSNQDTEIIFRGKTFSKGLTFSKKLEQSAIRYCQENSTETTTCLMVENSYYYTIWLEKIQSNVPSAEKIIKAKGAIPVNTEEKVKSNKPVRKYRGQVY